MGERQIKKDEDLKTIPVVVTSSNPKDIEVCYRYGVNGYIKPIDKKIDENAQVFIDYWFESVILPDAARELLWQKINGQF